MNKNLNKLQEIGEDRWAWWAAVHWVAKSPTRLSNWTTKSSSSFWYTLHISINTFKPDNLLLIFVTFSSPFIWTWYIPSSMLKAAHTGLWDLLIFHLSSQLHVQWDSTGNLILATVVVINTMKLVITTNQTEKAMAPHSSTLAWKIPWTEEPGGPQSMGLWTVRHDWATSLSLFTSMHWRRIWQPTPVFLPGESQGQRSLVGGRPWDHTKSDTTDAT